MNAGELINSSSPAIPAAIDKRIIQDSRLFLSLSIFDSSLFHHDDFMFVEIEFPLNGRRRENRSGPSYSFYCSGAHHIKLKVSIASVV